MSKVSVLIAVYNAQNFLEECLNSLLLQTYKNWEAICVNDASTDTSASILHRYSMQDERIRVIELKQNCGQAHARNKALEYITGDYICMLDADDWLSDDAFERAVETLDNNVDTGCVLFTLVFVYPNGRQEPFRINLSPEISAHYHTKHKAIDSFDTTFPYLEGKEAFRLNLICHIHGLYMVRKQIHLQYPYDETCHLYSDDNTAALHYLVSTKVRFCLGKYFYRQHQSSATHRVSLQRFDRLKACQSMSHTLKCLATSNDLIREYEQFRWLVLIDVYMFYHCHGKNLSHHERRCGLNQLRLAYEDIEKQYLNKRITRKFGYNPMPSFLFFRLQEWIYFTLRSLKAKLSKNNTLTNFGFRKNK